MYGVLSKLDNLIVPPPYTGFPVGPQSMLPEQFAELHRSISPASAAQHQVTLMFGHFDLK